MVACLLSVPKMWTRKLSGQESRNGILLKVSSILDEICLDSGWDWITRGMKRSIHYCWISWSLDCVWVNLLVNIKLVQFSWYLVCFRVEAMLAASWSACGAEAPPDLLLVTKVRLLLFHHQDDEVDGDWEIRMFIVPSGRNSESPLCNPAATLSAPQKHCGSHFVLWSCPGEPFVWNRIIVKYLQENWNQTCILNWVHEIYLRLFSLK